MVEFVISVVTLTVTDFGITVTEVGGAVTEVGGEVSEVGGAVTEVGGAVTEVGSADADVITETDFEVELNEVMLAKDGVGETEALVLFCFNVVLKAMADVSKRRSKSHYEYKNEKISSAELSFLIELLCNTAL